MLNASILTAQLLFITLWPQKIEIVKWLIVLALFEFINILIITIRQVPSEVVVLKIAHKIGINRFW